MEGKGPGANDDRNAVKCERGAEEEREEQEKIRREERKEE